MVRLTTEPLTRTTSSAPRLSARPREFFQYRWSGTSMIKKTIRHEWRSTRHCHISDLSSDPCREPQQTCPLRSTIHGRWLVPCQSKFVQHVETNTPGLSEWRRTLQSAARNSSPTALWYQQKSWVPCASSCRQPSDINTKLNTTSAQGAESQISPAEIPRLLDESHQAALSLTKSCDRPSRNLSDLPKRSTTNNLDHA